MRRAEHTGSFRRTTFAAAGLASCIVGALGGWAACARERPKATSHVSDAAGAVATTTPAPTPTTPSQPAPSEPAPQQPAAYTFSEAGSQITFVGLGGEKREVTLARFSGTIAARGEFGPLVSITADLDLTSLGGVNPSLIEKVGGIDLLAIKKFPNARFDSTAITRGGEMGATNTITGTIRLRGADRTVDIPATVHVNSGGVHIDAEAKFDVSALGRKVPANVRRAFGTQILARILVQARAAGL